MTKLLSKLALPIVVVLAGSAIFLAQAASASAQESGARKGSSSVKIETQTATPSMAPTFYKDVLPILQTHCQSCHRPGEIGPMPLLTYEQTRRWARAIQQAVESKKMPPWFADPQYGTVRKRPLTFATRDRNTRKVGSGEFTGWRAARGASGTQLDKGLECTYAGRDCSDAKGGAYSRERRRGIYVRDPAYKLQRR